MRLLPLAALAALALALALPAGASAACAPQTTSLPDHPADGEYLQAPEITSLDVSVDAACTLLLSDAISNRSALGPYDRLQWTMDTDANVLTGRTSGFLAGMDYGVILTSDGQARVIDADGGLVATLPAAGPFSVAVPAAMIGVGETSAIRIQASAFTEPAGHTWLYDDEAPDAGAPPFIVQLHPAALAAPTAAAPTTTPAPAPAAPAPAPCVVPKLTGRTMAAARKRLHAAGCALGAVHRHRARGRAGIVLASSPKAGTRLAPGAKVAVTVRSRRR